MAITLESRYRGCLLGLACGDAVGTAVEFSPRGSFAPLTDMVGGGPFGLQPGQWTDDTAMAVCLAQSLLHRRGFDAADQMNRYVNWWRWGYPSPTGECFDIGMTVQAALARYLQTGDPMAGSRDPASAGNGSLMRLAPAVMHGFPDIDAAIELARSTSRTTHAADEAVACCALLAEVLCQAFQGGADKLEILHGRRAGDDAGTPPKVRAMAGRAYLDKSAEAISGSGYCVDSLEAALWCVATTGSFAEAVLAAANLGDDADTTAAVAGQVAGAWYGVESIPPHWLERLYMCEDIDAMARGLLRK